MNRKPGAVLLALLLVAQPVAVADTHDDGLTDVDLSDTVTVVDAAASAADALVDRAREAAAARLAALAGNSPDATTQRDRIRTIVNDGDWAGHLNQTLDEHNASAPNGTTVLRLDIVDETGQDTGDASLYVIIKADGEGVTNVTAVNATDKTVDGSMTLTAAKASNLADDLADYQQQYVARDETPDAGTLVYYDTKYGIREVTS